MQVLKAPGPLPETLRLRTTAHLDFAKGGSARVLEDKALGITVMSGRPTRDSQIVTEITAAHLPDQIFATYTELKEAWNGATKSESSRSKRGGKGNGAGGRVGNNARKADANRKKRV